jgi:hypothetical protein
MRSLGYSLPPRREARPSPGTGPRPRSSPWRSGDLRFGLSYRDVEELLAERGIEVDHDAAA